MQNNSLGIDASLHQLEKALCLLYLQKKLMSKKKSNGKVFLYLALSILGIAALVGGSIAISKQVKGRTTSDVTTSEREQNSEKTNTKSSSDGNGSSYSSSLNSSSSDQNGQQENVIPTINCSTPREVYWHNTEDQVELNETLLVATINGLPANATDEDRELYFWSDDDDLDEWIEISQTKNGNKVILNSPYVFESGDSIKIKQIKPAPATGFYKIPLWIYSVHYEPEQVYNCVDFWFQQR